MEPLRKTAETIMALYVGLFGAFVAAYLVSGVNTIDWAGFDADGAYLFGWACLTSAIVHSFGIWLNGRWNWSPFIRLVGIVSGGVLITRLAWYGAAVQSTAGYTYLWICFGFLAALRTAVRDCHIAWMGKYGTVYH